MLHVDNDYGKARKQLQYCEENSDVPTDIDAAINELGIIKTQRVRKPPTRFCDTEESDKENSSESNSEPISRPQSPATKRYKNNPLPRPPEISLGR